MTKFFSAVIWFQELEKLDENWFFPLEMSLRVNEQKAKNKLIKVNTVQTFLKSGFLTPGPQG